MPRGRGVSIRVQLLRRCGAVVAVVAIMALTAAVGASPASAAVPVTTQVTPSTGVVGQEVRLAAQTAWTTGATSIWFDDVEVPASEVTLNGSGKEAIFDVPEILEPGYYAVSGETSEGESNAQAFLVGNVGCNWVQFPTLYGALFELEVIAPAEVPINEPIVLDQVKVVATVGTPSTQAYSGGRLQWSSDDFVDLGVPVSAVPSEENPDLNAVLTWQLEDVELPAQAEPGTFDLIPTSFRYFQGSTATWSCPFPEGVMPTTSIDIVDPSVSTTTTTTGGSTTTTTATPPNNSTTTTTTRSTTTTAANNPTVTPRYTG
jgi:hypothetical protein